LTAFFVVFWSAFFIFFLPELFLCLDFYIDLFLDIFSISILPLVKISFYSQIPFFPFLMVSFPSIHSPFLFFPDSIGRNAYMSEPYFEFLGRSFNLMEANGLNDDDHQCVPTTEIMENLLDSNPINSNLA